MSCLLKLSLFTKKEVLIPLHLCLFHFTHVGVSLYSSKIGSYELVNEKEKYKNIADEMDQTFAELAGY